MRSVSFSFQWSDTYALSYLHAQSFYFYPEILGHSCRISSRHFGFGLVLGFCLFISIFRVFYSSFCNVLLLIIHNSLEDCHDLPDFPPVCCLMSLKSATFTSEILITALVMIFHTSLSHHFLFGVSSVLDF